MTFAAMVRDLRVRAGLSQNGIASIAQMDHSTFSRYESGDRQPTREAVEVIAYALDLSRADTVRLMLSAGMVPENVSRYAELVDAMVSVVLAFEGRPASRAVEMVRRGTERAA